MTWWRVTWIKEMSFWFYLVARPTSPSMVVMDVCKVKIDLDSDAKSYILLKGLFMKIFIWINWTFQTLNYVSPLTHKFQSHFLYELTWDINILSRNLLSQLCFVTSQSLRGPQTSIYSIYLPLLTVLSLQYPAIAFTTMTIQVPID